MGVEFFFPLLGVCSFLASWGMVMLGRHLAEKNRILAREILHKERMDAMQHDASPPQSATDLPSLSAPASAVRSVRRTRPRSENEPSPPRSAGNSRLR